MADGDNMMDMFDEDGRGRSGVDAIVMALAPAASSSKPGLLNLEDILGGGAAPDPPATATQNGSMSTKEELKPAEGQIDVNLLSKILTKI